MKLITTLALASTLSAGSIAAQDSAAEMARKLQNPLANIRALMTDNVVAYNTGLTNDTSYNLQLQPVYAIDFEDKGFTFIPRAVIPIMGIEPGTNLPNLDNQNRPTTKEVWGLGDSILQTFFAPHVEGDFKWGIGPQVSLPTSTDRLLQGPGWGAGIAAIVTNNFTPNLSFAGILGNHWGFDGNFSALSIQPMLYYNIYAVPGMAIAYNSVIAADWKAKSSDQWTVPLGLTVSRTFDLGDSYGLDLSIGQYYNVARPDGAADWTTRIGVSFLFP